MNFVVFSANFPPQSDAEAFCTARFCSALAEIGNKVHVVTFKRDCAMEEKVQKVLVSEKIEVTYVETKPLAKRIWPRCRYLTTEWESQDYAVAIKTLAAVLSKYEHPILISRSNPESSHIIAYHARKHAYKWIAHFSDPIPFGVNPIGLKNKVWRWLTLRWVRKAISACDGISLTCEEVVRFYSETYGRIFDDKPHYINRHIGEPRLLPDTIWSKDFPEKLIVHAGMINPERGALHLVKALQTLNADGRICRFIQAGEAGLPVRAMFDKHDGIEVLNNTQPGLGAAVIESADVVFIPDVQVSLPYTPFMPSKFVYQIFSDKPLVLFTRPGSPMYNYFVRYPNAGLFYADYTHPETLVDAVRQALACTPNGFDRTALRRDFTRESVAGGFCMQLSEMSR